MTKNIWILLVVAVFCVLNYQLEAAGFFTWGPDANCPCCMMDDEVKAYRAFTRGSVDKSFNQISAIFNTGMPDKASIENAGKLIGELIRDIDKLASSIPASYRKHGWYENDARHLRQLKQSLEKSRFDLLTNNSKYWSKHHFKKAWNLFPRIYNCKYA